MRIENIKLKNYRNYKSLHLDLSNHPLIIINGDNGQGKTNLIEAIYICSLSKSYRTKCIKNLININYNFTHILLTVRLKSSSNLKINYNFTTDSKKKILIDNQKIELKKFIGKLKVVKFSPEDIFIVTSSPRYRKKFFDIYISQINNEYLFNLSYYNKITKQKNKILKHKNPDKLLIKIYNKQLSHYIYKINLIRNIFVLELQVYYNKNFKLISGNREISTIMYKSLYTGLNQEDIVKNLNNNMDKEIKNKKNLGGLQKDDFIFKIGDVNADIFASQGQQRCIILSLLISIIEYINKKIDEFPILLLDDVFGELDCKRRKALLDLLLEKTEQIFLTTTDISEIKNSVKIPYKILNVEDGKINF